MSDIDIRYTKKEYVVKRIENDGGEGRERERERERERKDEVGGRSFLAFPLWR